MIDDFKADESASVLLAHADKTEQQQRPTAESLGVVRRDGDLALRTPAAYGGGWVDAEHIARRLAGIGRACPATAWVAGTCLTAKTFAAASFSKTVLDQAFADPDALACGSGNPTFGRGERGADVVHVNGRWPNVSACEDAEWALLALMVEGVFSLAFLPRGALALDRDWQMAGMRGTGSHTLVAEDLTVPADHVVPAAALTAHDMLSFGIAVLAPVVGATRGALDVIDAMFASNRKPYMTEYAHMGDSPGARHWLAEAVHRVNRGERTMLAVAHAAASGEDISSGSDRLHLDLADAAQDCRAAMDKLLDLHGASGFKAANPLQRYWRDVAVGSRHPLLNPYLGFERLGRTAVPTFEG